MKGKFVLTVMVAMILVIALVTFLACARSAPELSEQKSPIVIGVLEDMSGPMGGAGINIVDGVTDAIRYINKEKGGISGHQIADITIDYKFDGTLALSSWERLKSEEVPIVVGFFAGSVPVLHQVSDSDRIPLVVSICTLDRLFPNESEPSYQFSTMVSTASIADFYCDTVEKVWQIGDKGRPPKVGFDVVSIGAAPATIKKKAKMEAEKRGWEYIVTTTSGAPADATTQVLQMKNYGVDFIYQMPTEQQAIVWMRELSRVPQFKPRFYGSNALGSPGIWGAVGEACCGVSASEPVPQWTDTDIPGIKLIHDLNAKWRPEVESQPGYYIRGFSALLMVAEALKLAISDVGYENINGVVMQKVMESIRDFDPLQSGSGYTYTSTDHQGLHGLKWYAWTKEGTRISTSDAWYIVPPLPEEQQRDAWWYKD